ncbi:hypothetical protein CANARDRAFT_190594, partial [[Candida] arabinofermentans NRRL YB-2248]
LPERYRSIFNFDRFNLMQSKSFSDLFNSNNNCVISSPTGSGKTVLFELAIIKLLIAKSQNESIYGNSKILYMAPTKALCTERYNDWCLKFQSLNCTIGLLTSDTGVLETERVKKSDLIICTPEKWDVLTRRWFDYTKLFDLVRLLLIDEIHTLRENRGTALEVVVTRMKTMGSNLRTIALSATVPNIEDISRWLTNKSSTAATTLIYGEEYRAVQLEKTVYGYRNAAISNEYQFDTYLNSKLVEVLSMHSKGKPVMIFCPTRNSCISSAKFLSDHTGSIFGYGHNGGKVKIHSNIKNKELIGLINNGVCYHHAGLGYSERNAIEDSFKDGKIKVLCSTSTLAVGVNLPAYLVVIKGTKAWTSGTFSEYSELDVLQMMGRAGRPQFETEGACVILTDGTMKNHYENLVKGLEKLESSLHKGIYEHITAEIALKTITSSETAFEWLRSTFFYQRYLRNPTAYPIINVKAGNHFDPEIKLSVFINVIIEELIQEKMVSLIDTSYECSNYGTAMAKNYVLFETMKSLVKQQDKMSLGDVLSLLSNSQEFKEVRLKHTEKKLYKEINSSPLILFPNKVDKNSDKISLLIQYELGGLEFPIYNGAVKLHASMLSDKMIVFRNAPRILKALIDIQIFKKDSKSLLSTLQLFRCISGKCWETSCMVLRQLEGVGLAYVRKFVNRNVCNLQDVSSLSREKIEYYLGLKPGSGTKFMNSIKKLPKFTLCCKLLSSSVTPSKRLKVDFQIEIGLTNEDDVGQFFNGSHSFINVIAENSSCNQLLDFRRMPLKKLGSLKTYHLSAELGSVKDLIDVHINCDELAGVGKSTRLDLTSVPSAVLLLIPNEKEESEFEFSDDDDEIDELLRRKPNEIVNIDEEEKEEPLHQHQHQQQQIEETSFARNHEIRPDGKFECNHKCRFKEKCRHICCKEGI